ncbi:MAG: hypothetical protein AAF950_15815 [Pseudomonadota bacterium]
MFVKIRGEPHYLWRVIDHKCEVLESSVQNAFVGLQSFQ